LGAGSRQRAAENFKAGRTDREASEAPASGPACRAFRGIPDGEPADVKGKVVGSSPAWGANRRLAALRAISRRFSKPPPSACPFYTSSERLPACLPIGQAPLAEFRAIQRPESKNGAVSFLDEKRNRLGWETHRSIVAGPVENVERIRPWREIEKSSLCGILARRGDRWGHSDHRAVRDLRQLYLVDAGRGRIIRIASRIGTGRIFGAHKNGAAAGGAARLDHGAAGIVVVQLDGRLHRINRLTKLGRKSRRVGRTTNGDIQ